MASNSDSQTPSNLPPTRYFDQLPTELLQTVFENLNDLPRSQESQNTLLSLCLTSKLCRLHAQPLLLKCIRTMIGAKQDVLKLLVENNSDATLAMVQTLLLDKEKLKNIVKWLKKFVQMASSLREVFLTDELPALKVFIGTNITTLSLAFVDIKLNSLFSLPELARLALKLCRYGEDGLNFRLPKLRHLALFRSGPILSNHEKSLLGRLAPQLVSLTVYLANEPALPVEISTSSSLSILFEFYPTQEEPPTLERIRHLGIPLNRNQPNSRPANHTGELAGLVAWTKLIPTTNHQLETLTLTSFREAGGEINTHPRPLALIPALLDACRDRNVEVIWDVRSGFRAFDDLVPPTFIQRSETRHARLKAGGSQ
ncbi:hypothetical protein JCM5350_005695 [Sporobolomyces pararoseus]